MRIPKWKKADCLGCGACSRICPLGLPVAELLRLYNAAPDPTQPSEACRTAYAALPARAGDCLKCGRCEDACPKLLPIRDFLTRTAMTFEAP